MVEFNSGSLFQEIDYNQGRRVIKKNYFLHFHRSPEAALNKICNYIMSGQFHAIIGCYNWITFNTQAVDIIVTAVINQKAFFLFFMLIFLPEMQIKLMV
jgi:hypothetical protein